MGIATAAIFALGANANAAEPVADPAQGRVGLRLSHEETARIGGGPIPALITMVVPLSRIGAGLHSDTQIYRDDEGGVHASLRQVISEAATHPDGSITVYLNAPGTRDGRVLDIYQNWTN
ncbi:hypothetical protein IT779_18850 [Nocardia sp. NEAU-351]|uniref:Uncharacterized protein n=1 Tax=Nocardia bovistercoris TaxID=2785916 RepID=A0A931IBJ7_9NOCA|nr:hypothetical protein [Nocardia bovistercoris]